MQKVNSIDYITIFMHAEPQDMPLFSSKENGKVDQWVHITVEEKHSAAICIKAGSECFWIVSQPIFRSRQVDIITHYAGNFRSHGKLDKRAINPRVSDIKCGFTDLSLLLRVRLGLC